MCTCDFACSLENDQQLCLSPLSFEDVQNRSILRSLKSPKGVVNDIVPFSELATPSWIVDPKSCGMSRSSVGADILGVVNGPGDKL